MPEPWRPGDRKRQHFGLDLFSPSTVLAATVLVSICAAWFAKDARFDYSVLAMRDKSSEAIATLLELQREKLATDYSIATLVESDQVESLTEQLLALPTVAEVNRPEDVLPAEQAAKAGALASLQGFGDLSLQLPATPDAVLTAASRDRLAALLTADSAQPADPELARALAGLDEGGFARLQEDLLSPLFSELRELRPRLLARPFALEDLPESVRTRLIAPDGRHRLEVIARNQLNDLAKMDRFVAEVEAVAPNIAGRTVVERGVGQSVVRSFKLAIVMALTGIVAVLLLYFREPLTPLLVLIPLGLTTLFTFAIIELSGLTLNMANILVVPLIFGLGVDTGIHVVHRYHAARSVSDVLQSSTPRAVTLSALTTIGTFFSLSFSPHKGAASIGLILSIAIAILMVVTFVVLPALLERFEPLRRRVGG
jgi:predicted RND superfamily exporter protein